MVQRKRSQRRSQRRSRRRSQRRSQRRKSLKRKQVGGYDLWVFVLTGWTEEELRIIAERTLKDGKHVGNVKTSYTNVKDYLRAVLMNFVKFITKRHDARIKKAKDDGLYKKHAERFGEKAAQDELALEEDLSQHFKKHPLMRNKHLQKIKKNAFITGTVAALGAILTYKYGNKTTKKLTVLPAMMAGIALGMGTGIMFGSRKRDKQGKLFVKVIADVWNNSNLKVGDESKRYVTKKEVMETLLEISKETSDKDVKKMTKELDKLV